jgi:hypothetical protein
MPDIDIADIFYGGGKLDIYMTFSENMRNDMQSGIFDVNINIPGAASAGRPEISGKVSQGITPTFTVFLLDISRSMRPYREDAVEYISQIMDGANPKAQFILAAFGAGFDILADENSSKEEIYEILEELAFEDSQTNLYRAIIDAVVYAEDLRENTGALVSVLVITDGIDVSDRTVSDADVTEKLKNSKVTAHTMQISVNIQENYTDRLREFAVASGGFFIVYESGRDRVVRNEFNDYLSNIYFASFDISSLDTDIASQKLTGTIYFTVDGRITNNAGYRRSFEIGGNSGGPEPGAGAGVIEIETEEIIEIEDETIIEETVRSETMSPDEREDIKAGSIPVRLIAVIGGGALLAGIAAVIIIIIVKHPGKKSDAGKSGIYMKLDIISGRCRTKKREFYLNNELLIGKNPKCDIIFADPGVSDKNSRIFIGGNIIYIEDLGSVNGTAISGMKIFAQNRLRGGDIISIGNVSFSLKF